MFCVTVEFEVAPAHRDAFLARMKRQAADSLLAEPGCRVFEVWTSTERPDSVHLHEVYDSAPDFDAHLDSPHFRAFDAEVGPWLTGRTLLTWDTRNDTA